MVTQSLMEKGFGAVEIIELGKGCGQAQDRRRISGVLIYRIAEEVAGCLPVALDRTGDIAQLPVEIRCERIQVGASFDRDLTGQQAFGIKKMFRCFRKIASPEISLSCYPGL